MLAYTKSHEHGYIKTMYICTYVHSYYKSSNKLSTSQHSFLYKKWNLKQNNLDVKIVVANQEIKRPGWKRCEIKLGGQGSLSLMKLKFLTMMRRPQNIFSITVLWNCHSYQKNSCFGWDYDYGVNKYVDCTPVIHIYLSKHMIRSRSKGSWGLETPLQCMFHSKVSTSINYLTGAV